MVALTQVMCNHLSYRTKTFISIIFNQQMNKLTCRVVALVAVCLLCISVSAQDVVKTVADKGTSGKFFAKVCAKANVAINKDDADVYSVYTDKAIARFAQLRVRGGKYILKPGDCVILKTSEAKEITLEPSTSPSSIAWSDLICPSKDMTVEEFNTAYGVEEGLYVYMLTNLERNGGFGFTHFGGTTMKAGNFYIITAKEPSASGRLDMEWVDADGNVENEATAINATIKEAGDDNGVYNLNGVKTAEPKAKGVYIRNGKKFVVK